MFDINDPEQMRARTVGYGVPYVDINLAVSCGTCKSPEGVPCVKRGGGSHTTRIDKGSTRYASKNHKLAMQCENAAYAIDPDAPLWHGQHTAHPCGTLGPHVLTECTEVI